MPSSFVLTDHSFHGVHCAGRAFLVCLRRSCLHWVTTLVTPATLPVLRRAFAVILVDRPFLLCSESRAFHKYSFVKVALSLILLDGRTCHLISTGSRFPRGKEPVTPALPRSLDNSANSEQCHECWTKWMEIESWNYWCIECL